MRDEQTNGGGADRDTSLARLLQAADLAGYENEMRVKLKLRNAGDLQYVEEIDLSSIGMSRPEQKRLRKEYTRMYPSGFVGKLKKVFARSESVDRKNTSTSRDDDDHHVIPLEKITLCKELGHGEFGSVYQASWKNNNDITQVAVKCVGSDKLLTSSSSFLQEAAIMTRMRHDHVVRLYGVVLDTRKVMMVSELATCGSLLECLHKPALRDSFPVHVLCEYVEQIAMGMAYLESQRLIHRDLAARNVLVFSPKLIKISDFGLSRSLGVGEDYYRSEFTPTLKLPIAWCAPECINFLKFTSKSDVWAYGVTLWEIFSYGEMPWKSFTGAQILEAVDRNRDLLERPAACPEDIYDLMKETWTHQWDLRPTFAEIVSQFPEKRAQTVRAVCDCRDTAADHLHFKKDDLIVVISRTPRSYPDGYYWFGSLKNGKLGLFRPTDTVAHLGSEAPTNNGKAMEGGVVEIRKDNTEKKSKKEQKEDQRERKKLMISEPVGEVRHTCHVGIDGTAFGLLQLDKKAMCPQSTSPSTSRGSVSQPSPSTSHTSSTSSVVQYRDSTARNGVHIKETMSLREVPPMLSRDAINLREAVSPPMARAPSQPPTTAPRGSRTINAHQHHTMSDPFATLERDRARGTVTPSAPPLTASAANSLKNAMTGASLSIALNGSSYDVSSSNSPSSVSTITSTSTMTTTTTQREPMPAPRGPVAAIYARGRDIPTSVPTAADTMLCDEIEHLNRDLTNYSISTLGDFSDTRPLLDSFHRHDGTKTNGRVNGEVPEARIRMMTGGEMKRITEKQAKEHRKADDVLREQRQREEREKREAIPEEEDANEGGLLATRERLATQQDGWNAAAQEAYKLLVECGTSLKQSSLSPTPMSGTSRTTTLERNGDRFHNETRPSVSPVPPRPVTPPHVKAISMRRSSNDDTEECAVSYSPQKKVHIIETKLIDGPARGMSPIQDHIPAFTTPMTSSPRLNGFDSKPPPGRPPKTRQFPVTIDERNLAYDNLNGFGAGAKHNPPPVPPKPKVSFVGVPSNSPSPTPCATEADSPGAASSIARSSLLSKTNKKEELIKF